MRARTAQLKYPHQAQGSLPSARNKNVFLLDLWGLGLDIQVDLSSILNFGLQNKKQSSGSDDPQIYLDI